MERFLEKCRFWFTTRGPCRSASRSSAIFVTTLYPEAPVSKTMSKLVQQFMSEQTMIEEVHAAKSNKFLSKLKASFRKVVVGGQLNEKEIISC